MVTPLGTIRKAFIWGRNRPNISDVKSRLRVLLRQLQRQKMRLEDEVEAIKFSAIRAHREGDLAAVQAYATELVRFRQMVLSIDRSRFYLLKILTHIQQAQTTAKTSMVLQDVGKILRIIGDATDAGRVVANVDEIARRLEEFEIERGIAGTSLDSATSNVSPEAVSRAMSDIEALAGGRPTGTYAGSDSLEATIRALEQELDR